MAAMKTLKSLVKQKRLKECELPLYKINKDGGFKIAPKINLIQF